MTAEDDFLNLADRIGVRGMLENPSIVPGTSNEQKGGFDFRPLTEDQKQQFLDSLEAKSKRLLADKVVRFGESAA